MRFRALRADEVECRVGQISEKGLSLLLYKTARTDAAVLDETVGPMDWECSYESINGVLYCTVSIWAEGRGWVSKQDCGTPSNMEADKGNASDAFKRASSKWGIGRELYTAPFIWINASDCNIVNGKNGKKQCYDRFDVERMDVVDGKITALVIRNQKTGKVVFQRSAGPTKEQTSPATEAQIALYEDMLLKLAEKKQKNAQEVERAVFESKTMGAYGIRDRHDMTSAQCLAAVGLLGKWMEK